MIACQLLTTGLILTASEAQLKIGKGDIPRNEKQMWRKIGKSQKDIEENLMSGDPRFTAELDLTRRKVADLMLDAEGDKKNKAVVKDLSRCWNYWVRETDEIVTEDLKEYNLATAAGKSFDPAGNNPQGSNPYIGAPIVYQQVPAPQAYYVVPPPTPNYAVQPEYMSPSPVNYNSNPYLNPDGSYQNGCIPPQGQQYVGPPRRFFEDAQGHNFLVQIGIGFKQGYQQSQQKQQGQRPGSAYRGDGKNPAPATHAVVVARATGRK
jgi:hypothetical protein